MITEETVRMELSTLRHSKFHYVVPFNIMLRQQTQHMIAEHPCIKKRQIKGRKKYTTHQRHKKQEDEENLIYNFFNYRQNNYFFFNILTKSLHYFYIHFDSKNF